MLEDYLPDSALGPAAEPSMGILPIAESLRQIAPRDAGTIPIEHCFDEATIVLGGGADMADPPREPVFDPFPLVVAQSISGHGSAFSQSRPFINHTISRRGRLVLRFIPKPRLVLRVVLQ